MLRVLVAVDQSTTARQAVRFAARLLTTAKDTQVTILFVRTMPPGAVVAGAVPGIAPSPLEREVERVERELLDGAAEPFRAAGLAVDTRVEIGQPTEEIVRVAGQDHYDLLVIGSSSHSTVRGFILGSVSAAVAGTAPCPVLLVPAGAGHGP